jgi:hypothetical protein
MERGSQNKGRVRVAYGRRRYRAPLQICAGGGSSDTVAFVLDWACVTRFSLPDEDPHAPCTNTRDPGGRPRVLRCVKT